ncbi:MAG TPA: glycoside hydrolase family 2 TIM barrel-domain containing protein, partial [Candidatus Sulfotelmatobacter sp.]|nr:glycoside hydrolase family 2 TIM barrel-domain containing protein [Candidatus Sulfotelmatobacter sp.]
HGAGQQVIDNRRQTMAWRLDGKEKETQVAIYPGAEHSPALRAVPDQGMGSFLVVKVNGQKILCRGGNWGMDDAMKRISRERIEPYVRLHRDANLTMIRNWSGQSTSETFYDLCDEYGLLVWNDFWLNTEGWNYNPIDNDLSLRNVEDILKRYRNHPSIALWCPRNEGVPPEPLHQGIDRAIRQLDGTRYYQPNSRMVNLRTSGPWSNMPLEKYFRELNAGFSTEMGASSIPSAEVMRTMMAEPDLWPVGDVWAYHDFHSKGAGDRGSILGRISRRYGEAQNLEDLCRKAQMVNYETYRAIYEGFNSRLWKSCSGILVWMSHPSWPSVVWQFYTWDYEPNASLFGAQKASEMVHIQMNEPDCKIAVINHGAAPLADVTATATVYDLSGHPVQTRNLTLNAAADACTDAFTLDWPASGAHFARLELRAKKGQLLSDNFYWHARDEQQLQQLNTLPKVGLTGKVRVKNSAKGAILTGKITNPAKAPALAVRLVLRDSQTGQRILPAYYSDSFFSLLPGQSREFRIETRQAVAKPQVDLDGWNVQPASLR